VHDIQRLAGFRVPFGRLGQTFNRLGGTRRADRRWTTQPSSLHTYTDAPRRDATEGTNEVNNAHRKYAIAAGALAVAIGMTAGTVTAATVMVSEQDIVSGWAPFVRDQGSWALASEYGAPTGFGSSALHLNTPATDADPGTGDDNKVTIGTGVPAGTPLSALEDGISYWTYRSVDSTATDIQLPAINLFVDPDGDGPAGAATLIYEPVYTEPATVVDDEGVWQQWDAYKSGSAKWWRTNAPVGGIPCAFDCFVAIGDILAANPDATILGVAVNQGGGNNGLHGAVDGLSLLGTTYDFEARVLTKDDCKDGGWQTFTDPEFRNQGDCVSYFATGGSSHGD
jgi:hypothetical protein